MEIRRPSFVACVSALLLGISLVGCRPREAAAPAPANSADAAEVDPKDRPFLEAGRPFYTAIAAGDHAAAHALLSSHARARMTGLQFEAPEDEAAAAKLAAAVHPAVDAPKFGQLLQATIRAYGTPKRVAELDVFETDPQVLSGQATAVEDRIGAMFAIGNMPATIPAAIRRASLRGQLKVELAPAQLAAIAQAHETTPEKLQADPDFAPYVTLKVVLVEEGGALRVGYFEFLPPSLFD